MVFASFERYLYNKLITSPAFHRWVRRIHARINGIPLHHVDPTRKPPLTHISIENYLPTLNHKMKAFRIIWWDEMKRAFRIW